MSSRKLSDRERANLLPPKVCRMIARETSRKNLPHRPFTTIDIAKRSGLSWERVVWISRQDSWDHISYLETELFKEGCGINYKNEARHIAFIRRALNPKKTKKPFRHWNGFTKRQFYRLMKLCIGSGLLETTETSSTP